MEKICAAEKNKTTDTMWVEKRGKYSEQKRALWCAKKNMTKKRWVDGSRDGSLILTYHQPHRFTSGHWFKKKKKKKKNNTGKEESKITEVKRALQSTTENRIPKVEKLSGTQSKKQNKKGEKNKTKNFIKSPKMNQSNWKGALRKPLWEEQSPTKC